MLTLINPLPATLPTEWEALMGLFYDEWRAQTDQMAAKPEEERTRFAQADIAALMPAKVNIAVMLGNMNYQVHNGGWAQWSDNGYYVAGDTIAKYLQRAMDLGQTTLAPILEALEAANRAIYKSRHAEPRGRHYFDDYSEDEDEDENEHWDDAINTQYWNANPQEELEKALANFDAIHGMNNYASAFERAA